MCFLYKNVATITVYGLFFRKLCKVVEFLSGFYSFKICKQRAEYINIILGNRYARIVLLLPRLQVEKKIFWGEQIE